MPKPAQVLFANQTTNGDSAEVDIVLREYSLIRVYGTFDGCTVSCFADFDNSGTYCAIVDGVWTADDVKQIYLKPNVKIKLTLASAGGSTDISAEVI